MDCSKGTELGGNQFIGFPAKTSVVKWDHKKSSQRKKITKIATEAAEQSHRQQTPSVSLVEKHKKSLRNLTHMTQSWLRMKNQQNKEKKSISTSIIHLPARRTFVCSLDLKVALHRKKLNNFCRLGRNFAGWVREFYEQKQHRCIF